MLIRNDSEPQEAPVSRLFSSAWESHREGSATEVADSYRGMFEAVMTATLSAIIIMGEDRKIRMVNQAALRLFSCEKSDLMGQNVSILIADQKMAAEHDSYVRKHLETGTKSIIWLWGRMVRAKRHDGTSFPALLGVDRAVLPNGETVFVGVLTDNSEQEALRLMVEAQNERLESLLMVDVLTGVSSRRAFEERYPALFSVAERDHSPLSVVMFDLDHFKTVNDEFGHDAGDEVLRELWALLSANVKRSSDMVARYGGEEFVLLLPGTEADGAMLVAEFLREVIERHSFLNGTLKKTASFWVATKTDKGPFDPAALIKESDLALYQAKSEGRNRVFGAID